MATFKVLEKTPIYQDFGNAIVVVRDASETMTVKVRTTLGGSIYYRIFVVENFKVGESITVHDDFNPPYPVTVTVDEATTILGRIQKAIGKGDPK